MANWCSTSYVIEGDSETLQIIANAVSDCMNGKVEIAENSSKSWEGNTLHQLGIEVCKGNDIRGFFSELPRLEDGVLKLYAEEAWNRTDFAELLYTKYPEIQIYWMAIEPGFYIYETSDVDGKYFQDRYYVDSCVNGDCQSEYFKTSRGAYEWIEEISGCRTEEEIEDWNERYKSKGDYIFINKIKKVHYNKYHEIDYEKYLFD